jgi:hypothetical protein
VGVRLCQLKTRRALALFGIFLTKIKSDIIVSTVYSPFLAFHGPTIGLIFQSPDMTLMLILLIVAHFFSHDILTVRV